jgi:1-acyl-sn-glycerol-3-phosphate acyltransferase
MILVTILLLSPLLLILTLKEEYYHILWKLIRIWSRLLIYGMGFRLKITKDQQIESDKSYLFCANHASFLDPFVLAVLSKNPIVFVGKKELVNIPIFGFFYKRAVIMVDRSSAESRRRVFEMATKRLQKGVSIAIFPEGLVPEENVILAPFKKGAFSLAIDFKIPIVPQVYFDCKRFFSWNIFKGRPGILRVHQHKFLQTANLTPKNLNDLKEDTFGLIYNSLVNDKKYMKDTNSAK